jgi:hypothetical protein
MMNQSKIKFYVCTCGCRVPKGGLKKYRDRGMKAMEWKPRIADVMVVRNEIYVEERE